MPQGRPHENWEEASCSCGESPPNCTITLHKRVLADGDKWVEQKMVRRGRCVPCGAGPREGGGAGPIGERNVCGPNISAHLRLTLDDVSRTFVGWTAQQQRESCGAISSLLPWVAVHAWDIMDLRVGGGTWIVPGCGTGKCQDTAEVDGGCYSIVGINYILFGFAWFLCGFEYWTLRERSFWYPSLAHLFDQTTAMEADLWAVLGYHQWPQVVPTKTWRSECELCSKQSSGYTFAWHWRPHHSQ